VPLFDLRRLVHDQQSRNEPLTIVYERDGITYRVPPVGTDAALATAPTYWEKKLLSFREVHLEKSRCGH
jgi:hypothetical protein